MGLFAKKYKVDYCGQKMAYPNAKDEYRAGEKVTLYFDMIAMDTNYSFTLDGARVMRNYDPKSVEKELRCRYDSETENISKNRLCPH